MWYRRGTEVTYQVVIHALVGVIALSALFPLVYVIGMSLTSQVELIQRGYFVIIPHEPKLNAYVRLLDSAAMWRALLMSVMRSSIGPLLGVALTLVGAYVLSHRTLPGRNLLLLIVLLTILFHGGMIPTYLVVRNLGVMNTFWALIVPLLVEQLRPADHQDLHREPAGGTGGVGAPGRRRPRAAPGPDRDPAGGAGAGRDRHVQHRSALE